MNESPVRFSLAAAILLTAMLAAGCQAPPAAPPPVENKSPGYTEKLRVYVPTSRPADPVTDAFPTAPQDAKKAVPLRYTLEIWEILLPRDSVSRDESFWKRVDEPATPEGQQLLKNGIRVGELPATDVETVRKLIEDRGGKRTTYNGVNGKEIEIPVRNNVLDQIIFYHNRQDELVGRTWERCDDYFNFSFETTPRNPDRIRIALTPGVRSRERQMVYTPSPGKDDGKLDFVTEQSEYDVTVNSDLSLDKVLVIAPSSEASQPHSIGATFLLDNAPSQQHERFLMIIPHAYTREDVATP